MKRALTALLLLAFLAVPAFAELTPERRETAEGLIAKFASDDGSIREKAVDDLARMGPDVIALINETLAKTKDAEVKLRCDLALARIEEDYAILRRDGRIVQTVKVAPSHVTIDVKGAKLRDVLQMMHEQSGNRLMLADFWVGGGDEAVTLKVTDATYWEALDALCLQTRRFWLYSGGNEPMFLIRGPKVREVGACAGPCAIKVMSARRTVSDRMESNFRVGEREEREISRQVRLSFAYVWEDRLGPLAADVVLREGLTPDGHNALFRNDTVSRDGFYRKHSFSEGSSVGFFDLYMDEVPRRITGPLTFKGYFELHVPLGEQQVTLKNVFAGGKQQASDHGLTVTLERIVRDGELVTVHLHVKAGADFRPKRIIHLPRGSFGFRLVDPRGGVHPRLEGLAWSCGKWDSLPYGRENPYIDRELDPDEPIDAHFRLGFCGVPDIEGEWSLVYVLPESIETRKFPFIIEDVPLPPERK